jgi:hypothetical protein
LVIIVVFNIIPTIIYFTGIVKKNMAEERGEVMPLHPATYGLGSSPPVPDQSKINDFRCVRSGLDLCEDVLCRISSEMRQEKPSGFEFRVVPRDHPVRLNTRK